MCSPQSAVGAFYRREPNPRFIAGTHMFTGGALDTAIADPDLHWDEATQRWRLYYQSPHGMTFDPPGAPVLRHATSPDLAAWTFEDTPSLTLPVDGAAWDATHVTSPSVVYNPDAPPDRRYLMMYSGASGTLPNWPFPAYSIGAAFSADGKTFTRVPAAQTPKFQDGLVFTGADAYPGSMGAIVADPEVVFFEGTYHLWFSSFGCSGIDCQTIDARGIGHATSADGIFWQLEAAPVPSLLRASADAASGGAQPSVVYDALHCRWEMWQTNDLVTDTNNQTVALANMAGVWHATSMNATSWSINYNGTRDLVWDEEAAGEGLGLRTGADVALKGTGRYMVYVGFDDENVPSGSLLPTQNATTAGVMTLNVATRDAP